MIVTCDIGFTHEVTIQINEVSVCYFCSRSCGCSIMSKLWKMSEFISCDPSDTPKNHILKIA